MRSSESAGDYFNTSPCIRSLWRGATEETSEPVEEEVVVETLILQQLPPQVLLIQEQDTEEPCPEAVGSVPTGANPSQGCIYLGLLNDYKDLMQQLHQLWR